MVRIGGDKFWRGMTCHMAILALPYGVFVLEWDDADVEGMRRAVHGAFTAVQADLEGILLTCPADANSATFERLALASDIA